MSIQTELARINGAKADLQSWVEENGVTVPDGTLIDGLVELAKTVETGGGGGDTEIDGLIDNTITEISNNRVKRISSTKFADCSQLTTVYFPAVTIIEYSAFSSCVKLTTAYFPAATSIGSNAFFRCSQLTTVDFSAVISIGSNVFQSCSQLTTAYFPVVNDIGSQAFNSCVKLTTAYFPAATSIGSNAFEGCSQLTTVDFPAVTVISAAAFRGCSELTTADFHIANDMRNVTFANCSKLTTLILRSTGGVCTLSNTNALTNTPIASGIGYIYVPASLVDSYKVATNWSTYADQIRAIEDYPDITGGAA